MFSLIGALDTRILSMIGLLFAFLATFITTKALKDKLPRDQGRAFAQDGMLSAGKPRGAGIIFVLAFVLAALLFAPISIELVLYLVIVVAEMLTGYFDDAAEKPWNEYLKGALDLGVAVAAAVVYLIFNGSTIRFALFGAEMTLHPVVFAILTIVLVWASINVTNCSDGVDGLSASLCMVTLASFVLLDKMLGSFGSFDYASLLFMGCLLAYLWFNATPSLLLMGDAGSRAMGIMIAIAALKSRCPVIYLLLGLILILDGGLGLIKVTLLRFLKIHIMKNITTPIHDHVRKRMGWSNAQVVFRFVILQIVISAAALYLVRL